MSRLKTLLDELCPDGVEFIASHPMAGRETSSRCAKISAQRLVGLQLIQQTAGWTGNGRRYQAAELR